MKKNLAILGSTGSIGTQALDVVRSHPDLFGIEALTAQDNCDLLISQAKEFRPNAVVIGNENCYSKVSESLKDYPIKVFTGQDSIAQIVEMEEIDLVLTALVGYAGLKPTLNAIKAGKHIALANKETLVIAGDLVMAEARRKNVLILPVDSEHSAVFQCLAGEHPGSVEKIYLTASGGPFLGKSREQLLGITKEAALQHPNWKMGHKITVDSASMMNKGLEVIEARWLFNLQPEQIDVIIHPQSVIHFMGHGGKAGEQAILLFENEAGGPQAIHAKDLMLSVKKKAFLATLNACVSAKPGATEFGNLARLLVERGLPYALGMRFSIPDDAALRFSRALYENLALGVDVEEAVFQARRSLLRDERRVLIRNYEGITFDYPEPEQRTDACQIVR
ncbi:MAG: 1-deoxy-D-xylulose-5-phosphate reductoisomerase [Bacteroidota bacterium]